jgi:shikimate kinase
MGFPFEADYARREALYLSNECRVLEELLDELEAAPSNGGTGSHLVIDTTGSVVYTGDAILQRLRQQTVVIYLALPPAYRAALLRAYERRPRPVLWREHFKPNDGESQQDALRRCYAHLVEARDQLYRRYAHLEILWEPSSRQAPDVKTLLAPASAFLNQ